MTNISIVVVCFNKWNFTKSCIDDLFKLDTKTHQIIVIDNASSDETNIELSKINKDNFLYIKNNENLFHSKACNIGFGASAGEYVIFLNNDIRVKSDHSSWAQSIVKHCNTGIIGPTMGQLDVKFNFIKEANQELPGNSYLSGWFIASSKENWAKLDIDGNNQIFDEKLPFYFNDVDISFRARKLGIPLMVVPVPITHFGKISAQQVNIHRLYTEGKLAFTNKWGR